MSYVGWDNGVMKARASSLFGRINGELEGFVAEMKAQALGDSVVFVSASEFGALNGGNVSNKCLEFVKPWRPQDLGRGRFVPECSWDSVTASIAEWMGVEASQVETVFPNIGCSDEDNLISASDLFVAVNTTGNFVE